MKTQEYSMESDRVQEIASINDTTDELGELDAWSKYILDRRQRYFQERALIIGHEYDTNRKSWDYIIEREWGVMEERLRGGVGVEQEVIDQFGEEFFLNREALIQEIMELTSELPHRMVGSDEDSKSLKIYTFEDFLMLSKQGIFREETFLLDPQSRWKKKVASNLYEYGFVPTETVMIEGVRHYVIGKAE